MAVDASADGPAVESAQTASVDGAGAPPLEDLLGERPRRAVLTVRLLDATTRLVRRGPLKAHDSQARALALLLIASLPAMIYLLGLAGSPLLPGARLRGPALVWCFVYVVLVAALLVGASVIASGLERLAASIRSLLPEEADVEPLRRLLDVELKPRRQAAMCVVLALFGTGAAAAAFSLYWPSGGHTWSYEQPGAMWYAVLFVAGLFAVDGVSWVVRLPFIASTLCRAERLNVILHAPGQTGGILALSSFYSVAASFAAVGFVLFSLPFAWAGLVVRKQGFESFDVPFVLAVFVTVLWIALSPQWQLSRVTRRERERIGDELARRLPQNPLELLNPAQARLRQLYDEIAGTTVATVQGRAALKEASKVLAAVTPLAIAVLKKTLS